MSARFEIVRSDAPEPWHARFIAANGRIVWTTEQYSRSSGARNAIASIADVFRARFALAATQLRDEWGIPVIEIRDVDERVRP